MRFSFGNSIAAAYGVSVLGEHRKPNPNRPCPDASAEMEAFDDLPPEVRASIANSPFGTRCSVLVAMVTRRGASTAARERLNARGLMPCDVGTEGVVLEEMALLEDVERKRIERELRH